MTRYLYITTVKIREDVASEYPVLKTAWKSISKPHIWVTWYVLIMLIDISN